MRLRYLLLAALLGGLVSFAWGAIAHVSMLLPSLEPKSFTDSTAVVRQFLIEAAVALLLAWVLLRLPVWPALGTGSLFATIGVAAGMEQLLPEANWYGFPIRTQLAELAILVVGWFLMGLVIGWLRNRMLRSRASEQ
jgi:hypothetical protein